MDSSIIKDKLYELQWSKLWDRLSMWLCEHQFIFKCTRNHLITIIRFIVIVHEVHTKVKRQFFQLFHFKFRLRIKVVCKKNFCQTVFVSTFCGMKWYRKITNIGFGLIDTFKHILVVLYSGGLYLGAYFRRASSVSICVFTTLKPKILSIKCPY